MKKPLVITHCTTPNRYCPDGAAAAWVAAKAHNFEVELYGEIYRQEGEWERLYRYGGSGTSVSLPYDPSDREIIFVDWAGYPVELMKWLSDQSIKMIVLDHHKTRAEDLSELGSLSKIYYGYVPTELGCGASIAWDYFFPLEDRPWFLKHVRARDTNRGGFWQGKTPYCEAINFAIGRLRKGITTQSAQSELFEVFEYLYSITEGDLDIGEGMKEVELKNKISWSEVNRWQSNPQNTRLIEAYPHLFKPRAGFADGLNSPNPHVIDHINNIVPLCQISDPKADRFYSWIGTYLSEINPDAPFVCIQTTQRNEIQLRKPIHSNADCGEIARCFGGGGHVDAAGFPISY